MKKIQRAALKFLLLILLLVISRTATLLAQPSSHRLVVADSLFRTKQYTQSLLHYHTILEQKQYTQAMLLRMAYIEEGLNNIGQAMYFLNLYYRSSNDKSVVSKMEDMATKFKLEGYKTTDTDRILSFYHDYHFYLTGFLVILSLFLGGVAFYSKMRLKRRPIGTGVFLLITLALLFFHINFGQRITTAIVTQPNTYLMKGPSAGAPVAAIIDEGHRVEVIGQRDVWLRIRWNGEIAYVKNTSLLPVQF